MKNLKEIKISEELKSLPFHVIAYTMEVEVISTAMVNSYMNDIIIETQKTYQITDVVQIPKLKISRDAYKKLGIDPSRYRLATESLIRRIVKGYDVYRINDIVDLGNILSILTKRSVCVVDLDKIQGDIIITKGQKEDVYEGINRGKINITNMPVYGDEIGYFGTPTSDTIRTAITPETKNILVMIICFDNNQMVEDEQLLIELYTNYGNAKNLMKINEV